MADRHNRDIDRPAAPLPDPLPIPAVDSHAHLEIITNSSPDDPAIKKVIDESASVGINRIVQVGYSAEQSEWSLSLAKIYKGQVLATVALHPNEAPVVTDLEADLSVIERLSDDDQVRGNGEGVCEQGLLPFICRDTHFQERATPSRCSTPSSA